MARVRWLKAKAETVGVKLKILIALYQMLQGIGITFNIRWTEFYGDALRIVGSIVQIDLPQAMPMDCIANFGFFGSLIVRTAAPLLLIVLLAGLSKLFKWYEKVEVASTLSSGWFVVLFLVYPSCCTAVFQAFMCDELDDGSAYLRVDYSMQCYAENKGAFSEEYKVVMAYAILMSFVYPLGTPLLYTAVLYANRKAIAKVDRLERGLMKFIRSPKTEDATGKFREAVHQNIRQNNLGTGGLPKLTGGYEMRVYWFEVFECVRKICLIGLPIFVEPGSSAQLIVGLLVCFISYGMYASYEPYIKDSDDWLSKVCQVSLFFSLVSSIALKVETDSSTEALGVLLLFTLAVPPVTAFLFESGLDFEKGCYVSYVKKKVINGFASTLGRCFDHYLYEEGVVGVGTKESCTAAAKVSDQESAAKLERSARASSSERPRLVTQEPQEPQELSGSNVNDPDEPENKISWYIVEDGPYSMCIMGFNPEHADDFENGAAEYGTTFYLVGQGPRAKQQARSELEDYNPEYSVHAPPGHHDTLYYIVQPHGEEATVKGMTAIWEPEAHKYLNYTVFYLYVGEGQVAEQEARRDLHNFSPSGYNPSHDSQGTPQTETNSIEQSLDSIEHNSKLGGWIETCVACDPGSYCPEGASAPLPCAAGTHSDATNLTTDAERTPTAEGHYAPTGSTQQTACSPGTVAPNASLGACLKCEAGTFQATPGQLVCGPCTPGSYCAEGAAAALPCKAGTYQNETTLQLNLSMTGPDDCLECPPGSACGMGAAEPGKCSPGTVAPNASMATCVRCAAGTYQEGEGEQACVACEQGSYCPEGASAPLPCAEGSYSSSTSLASADQCTETGVGHFAPTASTQQTQCSPGTVASTKGLGACMPCAAGSFMSVSGQSVS